MALNIFLEVLSNALILVTRHEERVLNHSNSKTRASTGPSKPHVCRKEEGQQYRAKGLQTEPTDITSGRTAITSILRQTLILKESIGTVK